MYSLVNIVMICNGSCMEYGSMDFTNLVDAIRFQFRDRSLKVLQNSFDFCRDCWVPGPQVPELQNALDALKSDSQRCCGKPLSEATKHHCSAMRARNTRGHVDKNVSTV